MNMFPNFFKKIIPDKKIIFIVDDNDVYAKSLQTFIQIRFPDIKEVKIFRIGEMCLMELHNNPSIIIMDYFLNSKYEKADNGLEIIKRIKVRRPQTDIIVLSVQTDFNVFLEATEQYNCIYVQKDQKAFNKVEHLINEIFSGENPPALELLN